MIDAQRSSDAESGSGDEDEDDARGMQRLDAGDDDDDELLLTVGMRQAVRRMSKEHGFQENVVWAVCQGMGTLELADEALTKMRQSAHAVRDALLEEWKISREEPMGRERGRERFDTRFAPARTDDRYEPPAGTRARAYNRLVEQGRGKDARMREAWIAGWPSRSWEEGNGSVIDLNIV